MEPAKAAPEATAAAAPATRLAWRDEFTAARRELCPVPLSVTVCEPMRHGTFRPYVDFTVKTEGGGFGPSVVRRRYSEFRWLREALCRRFRGLVIPMLPQKGGVGAVLERTATPDSDYVQQRQRVLQLYVQALVDLPYVIDDPALHAFLRVESEDEWAASMKETEEQDYDRPSPGLAKWRRMLEDLPPNPLADRAVASLIAQGQEIARTLARLVDATQRFIERHDAYRRDVLGMEAAFFEWTELERRNENPEATPVPNTCPLSTSMTTAMNGVHCWGSAETKLNNAFKFSVMAAMKFELLQVEGYVEHLQRCERLQLELTRAEGALARDREKRIKSGEEASEVSARLERDVAFRRAELDHWSRAASFCEFDRFNETRRAGLLQVLGKLAAAGTYASQLITSSWKDMALSLQLDPKPFLTEAMEVMDSTSVSAPAALRNSPRASEGAAAAAASSAAGDAAADGSGIKDV